MRKEAWSQLLTAARWRDTPATRLDRPQRQQHGRPGQQRAVVARGQAVVDRAAEGVGQQRLGEHPDDSEEHPERERAELLPPDPEQKAGRGAGVRASGIGEGEQLHRRFTVLIGDDGSVAERSHESMTAAQKDALAAELAELEGPKRAEMVEAIATARGFGDLSENFAYHDAKNEQGLLERKITILRSRIENAVVVEHAAEGVVGVGSVVEVEDEQGGRFEVEISSVGGVSTDSPLGGALIGAKVGDTVEVKAPKGSWNARVVSVRSQLVEAALGLVEAVARQRLDRVGGAADERLGVVLGRERREHVVGDRPAVAAPGTADADADAQELGRAERLPDRAKPVVTREPAAEAHLDAAGVEVDVVVDDGDLLGRELEEARGGAERAAGEVHVRLRLQQRELQAVDADLGELAGELRLERAVVAPRQLVDDQPADVVPVARVLAARVAEADDEKIERRGALPPTEEAH